jgi:precorrin-2 dehydrogenase/sirohydrochlorin ferrochelatase
MSLDTIGKSAETFYPINIKLKGKRVLFCGGSQPVVAEISRLIDFGANVDVVAPHMAAELQDLALAYGARITLHKRKLAETDFSGLRSGKYSLAFAYSRDCAENEKLATEAHAHRVMVSTIDDICNSDYVIPSIIKRGHLKIAVSADSISQPLERALLQRIEASFVSEIDNYTLFLTAMQELIAGCAQDEALKKPSVFSKLMRDLAESDEILSALERKNFEEANHHAQALLQQTKAEVTEHAS